MIRGVRRSIATPLPVRGALPAQHRVTLRAGTSTYESGTSAR